MGGGCGYKRARGRIFVVIELFHISIVVVDTQSHTFEGNYLELNTHMHPYSYTNKYKLTEEIRTRLVDCTNVNIMRLCMPSCFSCVQFYETPWTVALQAPLSMGFSRQEYWNGLPCPTPGDLPNPRIELVFLMSPILASGFFTTWEW